MDYRNPLHTCRLMRLCRERPHGDPTERSNQFSTSDCDLHIRFPCKTCLGERYATIQRALIARLRAARQRRGAQRVVATNAALRSLPTSLFGYGLGYFGLHVSTVGGTVRPSTLAVVRLTTRSILVGCSTGSSPGHAPRRILST